MIEVSYETKKIVILIKIILIKYVKYAQIIFYFLKQATRQNVLLKRNWLF